jgi:two-component system OmpR family sensor kinase
MTIKNKLYISFSLILFIIIFIIGVFFYSTYSLNSTHIKQSDRYEQIRRVDKLKEYNSAFVWIVIDIITNYNNQDKIKEPLAKARMILDRLAIQKESIISNAESNDERKNLIVIFDHFDKIDNLIHNKILATQDKERLILLSGKFEKIRYNLERLLIEETAYLQQNLNSTEKSKDAFIDKVKLELVVLLFIAFSLSFIISTKIINDIKQMLDKLNQGVLQLFKNDENSIKIDIGTNNELSEITDNLNSYLEKQGDIIHSREELLRNISHELKTPITKGKFLVEKLKSSEQPEIVDNLKYLFFDIEELTSKLLQREKLNFATLDISRFKISTLVLESLSKLSIEDESIVSLDIDDDFYIDADKYYMTITLKNLIDNALKYATKYPILISTKDSTIYIKNIAPKLSNDFIYYIQPFTREPNQQLGHGLGLNIVNKITQMHNFELSYEYKEPYNIFYIRF